MEDIIELTSQQIEALDDALDRYDAKFCQHHLSGHVAIGIVKNGKIVAGLSATITAFKILYVSTVFVEEQYRRQGYGKRLMQEMEIKAKQLGVNTIRLDTFDWQGKEFYIALGYQPVGSYQNDEEHYAEYFFVKRL